MKFEIEVDNSKDIGRIRVVFKDETIYLGNYMARALDLIEDLAANDDISHLNKGEK